MQPTNNIHTQPCIHHNACSAFTATPMTHSSPLTGLMMQSKYPAEEVPSRSPSAKAQWLNPSELHRIDDAIKNLLHRRGRFPREHPHLIFRTTAMKLTPQRFSAQCKNTLIIAFLSILHRSQQDLLGTLIQSYVLGHNPVVRDPPH